MTLWPPRTSRPRVTCSDDLGSAKVDATAGLLWRINPQLHIDTITDRYRPRQQTGTAVFCCVDSITARATIWRSRHEQTSFWGDGRLRGEVLRILTATDPASRAHYATTLFPPPDLPPGGCTTASTISSATIAAGLLLHQFTRWLRGIPTDADLFLNLLASELVSG